MINIKLLHNRNRCFVDIIIHIVCSSSSSSRVADEKMRGGGNVVRKENSIGRRERGEDEECMIDGINRRRNMHGCAGPLGHAGYHMECLLYNTTAAHIHSATISLLHRQHCPVHRQVATASHNMRLM